MVENDRKLSQKLTRGMRDEGYEVTPDQALEVLEEAIKTIIKEMAEKGYILPSDWKKARAVVRAMQLGHDNLILKRKREDGKTELKMIGQ